MKLAEHVDKIRVLIVASFRNRLGRLGITEDWYNSIEKITGDEQKRIIEILKTLKGETGSESQAYEKLLEEFTFTLFNRLAALKLLEAHTLQPEVLTRREQYAGRSFAHFLWLEQNPNERNEELEGLSKFIEEQFNLLSFDIPLFSLRHPYHLLPTAIELNDIINTFNQIEVDQQVENDIWKSDDVLGWLYESYNNYKKAEHKASKAKTEFDKVSIQSQVYTPRWVVKFLVDNSLGKLYLEMYPDSIIKDKYKIANAPKIQLRERKPLTEIKLIDPATGSGNFVLYGFDLFYDMYMDQLDNYGASYDEAKIPELIIKHNIFGIDIDDRAVQLAQLGLYVKVKRKKRSAKINQFNIVSSDFYLPDYSEVKHLFETEDGLSKELEQIVKDLWSDLQKAYKFGSLIKLEEKFSIGLHGLTQQFEGVQLKFFTEETLANYEQFRERFFINLQKAVKNNSIKQGYNFFNIKTQDAITFLQILTQKYDIAVVNPPYTDSSDFGVELKNYVDSNFKQPYKFNINLYATFIKRCYEIVHSNGKIALVHPPTFMYIKTYVDVREFILCKTHISLFVEWGYLGMFNPSARVDSAMYILEKETNAKETTFIKLNDMYEGKRYRALMESYEDLLKNQPNQHIYIIEQTKLKMIEGAPFIYWISDGFRKKFREGVIDDYLSVVQGLVTSNNERFLRYFWEIGSKNLTGKPNSKWVQYSKGGPFNKWYGNNWVVVNWENNGFEIKNFKDENGKLKSRPQSEQHYFREGITYCSTGSKGTSFRYLPPNHIISGAGPGILGKIYNNINYTLGFLNSTLAFYITDCLNPTVNTTQGDLKRIPFVNPPEKHEKSISELVSQNIEIKQHLCSYHINETNYYKNPLSKLTETNLSNRVISFLNYENAAAAIILINEAIINEFIFEVYELSESDKEQVIAKFGKPVGELPILKVAKKEFIEHYLCSDIEINPLVEQYINNLPTIIFDEQEILKIKDEFRSLYQANNDLEEFCIRHQLNPINLWFLFRESKILAQNRAHEICLEFLIDVCKNILMDDEDGIIPLVGLANEPRLLDRIEKYCLDNGFTSAQFMQLDSLLGFPVNEYLEHYFFRNLCEYLNLFMYLPKTPFIWHLTSGPEQGFEVFVIIYKWNRDSLFKLKTSYINPRKENLKYRYIQLADSQTAQAQNEKEQVRLQLEEISNFTQKLDELIEEGYDPKLDYGVGKNLAPLQKKGLLSSDVLNNSELEKYLNADW